MKDQVPGEIEGCRVITGQYRTTHEAGMNGKFMIRRKNRTFQVIVSDGNGWDHVSVSLKHRTPTWDEMCFIKSMFFEPDETAIQYHPAKSNYVNTHKYCLHLWRDQINGVNLPDIDMV